MPFVCGYLYVCVHFGVSVDMWRCRCPVPATDIQNSECVCGMWVTALAPVDSMTWYDC